MYSQLLTLLSVEPMSAMGFFGGAHMDTLDSAGHFTQMVVSSDIPADYHPGRFHILGLGLYVTTHNHVCICFSGLRRHGGTGPAAPFGQCVRPDAIRMSTIHYVAKTMLSGTARTSICALPRGRMLKCAPEMVNIRSVLLSLYVNNPSLTSIADVNLGRTLVSASPQLTPQTGAF